MPTDTKFTDTGIIFFFRCSRPLCTFTATHTFLYDELSAFRASYKTTLREAVRSNKRYFKLKHKKHVHKLWAYTI